MRFLDTLNDEIKEYYKILCPEFPEWLEEYFETPEMMRIHGTSMSCGTDYTRVFKNRYWYSNLHHSIGVALIVWNFTHDKKQTLAGLFHDIANPTFKHCIDFMMGDHEKQESTEERTESIIANSKEIMTLMERDSIKLEEVADYHIYPIADNDTPRLSSDRFEYTFSSGLVFKRVWELDRIKKMYDDIVILKNEDGEDEIGFKDLEVAEEYIHTVSKLWPAWRTPEDRTVMQFLADIVKSMSIKGYVNIDDLYTKSEAEIIEIIKTCDDEYLKESFQKFQDAFHVWKSDEPKDDRYCISVKAKRRYVIPLVKTEDGAKRINAISKEAHADIEKYFTEKEPKYFGFDFQFKPYEK